MPHNPVVELTPFNNFFLQYGTFLAAWNSFEVLVEIVIMRELRLTVEESCIVNAGLGFGAKVAIAESLLNRTASGNTGAAVLAAAHAISERNGFAHSFISVNDAGTIFTQVRREVRTSLTVKPKAFTTLAMQKHANEFYAKFEEAQTYFGITDEMLIKYQREIESFAKAPATPATRRRESPTNFRSAKQQRRHEQRAQRRAQKESGGQ